MTAMDLVIVGNAGGTNVGASLHRAAMEMGLKSTLCDARAASAGPRIASTLSWRLLGHRPLHLEQFSRTVVEECRRTKPKVLITTGLAPLTASSLTAIGHMGVRRVNYSTDDPWNPAHQSRWFLAALPTYDHVCTPRQANINDHRRHKCKHVSYLPFGYDESLWLGPDDASPAASGTVEPRTCDVFFAGAADKFRVLYIRELADNGIRIALGGDYWRCIPKLRNRATGHLSRAQLKAWTRAVPISLCLVRRANRDGHVMRSYEIPAIGGCMIAEDTKEHRRIFGADGEAVRYFHSPEKAAVVVRELLNDDAARLRLAAAAQTLIVNSGNSYKDRLISLLSRVEANVGPQERILVSAQ